MWANAQRDGRWIKMKLGMRIALGPGHIVLDGDPAPPPPKDHSPQFSTHVCCGQMAGWIKMPVGVQIGLGPGDFVLDGDPATLPKKGAEPPPLPNFWQMFIVAKRLDGSRRHLAHFYWDQMLDASRCHLVWRYRSQPRRLCV